MTHASRIPELLATHRALTDAPELWLDVSRGLVSPEEAARALTGRESPALIERSKALFAPPSAEQERAIRARVLEHATPRRRGLGWVAGGLALAAAIVLALTLRPPTQPTQPPLGATYQVELSAGWEGARGGAGPGQPQGDAARTFRIDQRVDFTLRPSAALALTELEVVLLAYDEQGHGHRLGPARRLTTRTGMVSFSEGLAALGLTAGTWQLVFVIGRPGQVPADPQRFDPKGQDAGDGDHAVARVKIRVLDIDEP